MSDQPGFSYNVNHQNQIGTPDQRKSVRQLRAQNLVTQGPPTGSTNRPLYALPTATQGIIAAARGNMPPKVSDLPGYQAGVRDTKNQAKLDNMEQARQAYQASTIQGSTDLAESAATQGSQRHGVYLPDADTIVTSTPDTRGANGPLGSFGLPDVAPMTGPAMGPAGGRYDARL